jgi:hypothetical protein
MRILAAAVVLCAFAAEAQELPKKLLLKCEGTETGILSSGLIPPNIRKFEALMRLENGELSETKGRWLATKNCKLSDGVIRCSDKIVVSLADIPGSDPDTKERRELLSTLSRETGEYNLFLQTTTLKGKEARPTGGLKLHRSGVCRPVGSPLF